MYGVMRVARAVSVLALLFLAACAAVDFTDPVIGFSKATTEAAKSLSDYEKTLDNAALEANISYALANPASLRAKSGECTQGNTR